MRTALIVPGTRVHVVGSSQCTGSAAAMCQLVVVRLGAPSGITAGVGQRRRRAGGADRRRRSSGSPSAPDTWTRADRTGARRAATREHDVAPMRRGVGGSVLMAERTATAGSNSPALTTRSSALCTPARVVAGGAAIGAAREDAASAGSGDCRCRVPSDRGRRPLPSRTPPGSQSRASL